jgi:hypothetical protein
VKTDGSSNSALRLRGCLTAVPPSPTPSALPHPTAFIARRPWCGRHSLTHHPSRDTIFGTQARHFASPSPPLEKNDVLRLRWNVAAFFAAFRDLRVRTQFLGDDVTTDADGRTAYRFSLVRCRLFLLALNLAQTAQKWLCG